MNISILHYLMWGIVVAISLFTMFPNASKASPTPASTLNAEAQASESALPADLVDERPSTLEQIWNYSTFPITWTWGLLQNNVLYWITPPSPMTLARSVSKKDASTLFTMLTDAGYKLKSITVDVGLIPELSFKFGQVRELSEMAYSPLPALRC